MPEPGFQTPSVPGSYRLTLALSLAFLAHTLLLAGLPSPLKDQQEFSHRLAFRLSTPASQATSANPTSSVVAENSREPVQTRHPDFSIAPQSPEITTRSSENRTPATSTPASAPAVQQPSPTPAASAPPMRASADASATAASHSGPAEQQETIQRISQSPIEDDPYLIRLATHLAKTLEQQRVPAITKLEQAVTMEVELRIMPNGALTRARVVQSTGLAGIDDAAYRAALAASPYPEPEGETTDRFEVTLVFTPKRR